MEEVSLPEKIDYVANKVKKRKRCSFKQLLEEQSSKMEVIVSFLAVLELIKIGKIEVHQEKTFDDIGFFIAGHFQGDIVECGQ